MPVAAVSPAGTAIVVGPLRKVKPAGGAENVRLNVSAAGPLLWTTAWNPLGTWAPPNGTVVSGSGATASVTPGVVGVTVTRTTACASSVGSAADSTTIRIACVPPWAPGAGVTLM